jgi:hypothetical protein
MKIIYKNGGSWPPGGEDSNDPVVQKMLREQLAQDRRGMMEGRAVVDGEIVELPYPSSWSGKVESDRPYLVDVAGFAGALPKTALRKGAKATVYRGGNGAIDMASKRAVEGVADSQAKSKLQNIADRALREAGKDESQYILSLQKNLDDAVMAGKIEEDVAEILFEESVNSVFNQALIDDIILRQTERLDKIMGPTMRELYETNPAMFDDIWYNKLISPRVTEKQIGGQPNYFMNEFGGKVKLLKK